MEFVGLNENFSNRGRRSAEQVEVMQRLWAEPHVVFKGKWHTIEDAGINPLPVHRRIPVWFGGNVDQTLERIATLGDGWIMNAYPPGDAAPGRIREAAADDRGSAGRDLAPTIGIELWTSVGEEQRGGLARGGVLEEVAGASHLTLTTFFGRRHHKRIAGTPVADQLAALRRSGAAVGDVL